MHLVEQLEFWRTRRMHLRMPAAQLPLEVAGLAHHVAQADYHGVERMQRDEHVDELLGRAGPRLGCQGQPGIAVREYQALDEAHHVELGAGDRGIGTVGHRPRGRNRRRRHRADEPPFPAHVVGGAQHSPGGRTAQGVGGTRGVGEPVGPQVGVAGQVGDRGRRNRRGGRACSRVETRYPEVQRRRVEGRS